MDYKQKYKEALERVKEIYNNECSSNATKTCCEEIFYELIKDIDSLPKNTNPAFDPLYDEVNPKLFGYPTLESKSKEQLDEQLSNYLTEYSVFNDGEYPSAEDIAYYFYELGTFEQYQKDKVQFVEQKAKLWQNGFDEGYSRSKNAK